MIATAVKKRTSRLSFAMREALRGLAGEAPGRRAVFLHIPKCAGSSVNLVFKRTVGSSHSGRTILIDDRIDRESYDEKIAQARAARFVGGHFGFETLEEVRGTDAITFTVLRDPFDRVRSTFGHFHTRARGNPLGHKLPTMTIEDYLASEGPEISQWTDNVIARQLARSHDRGRVAGMGLEEMVETAKAHLDQIDVVAFLDELPEAIARVTAAAKVPFDGQMPRENVTRRRSAKPAPKAALASLDEALRRLAYERVRGDLAVFKHALAKAGQADH